MKDVHVIIRRREFPETDLEELASIFRTQGYDVETGLHVEKAVDPTIVAGVWFGLQITTDEALRELVKLVWHSVLDRLRSMSERVGPTRVDVDFRHGETEFRVQVRTNEPHALEWIDKTVRRLSDLGLASLLEDLPRGAHIAFADRDMKHGEELIATYGEGDTAFDLDLRDGRWKVHTRRR